MDYETRQAILEQRNYDNDHRVRAAERGNWYENIDEKRMIAEILVWDEDDEEKLVEVPIKFEVCPTCNGKGTHVNPSIDAGGICSDEFYDDRDFEEDYMSGAYDVACYECGGKRVIPEIDQQSLTDEQKGAIECLNERLRWDEEDRAIQRAERAMGA